MWTKSHLQFYNIFKNVGDLQALELWSILGDTPNAQCTIISFFLVILRTILQIMGKGNNQKTLIPDKTRENYYQLSTIMYALLS